MLAKGAWGSQRQMGHGPHFQGADRQQSVFDPLPEEEIGIYLLKESVSKHS